MEGFVYHSDRRQGLTGIVPTSSLSDRPRHVHATTNLDIAALYLSGLGGDFSCTLGRLGEQGPLFIVERFKGAFDFRYNSKGSIYTLSGMNFRLRGNDGWKKRAISDRPTRVLAEKKVDNSVIYLRELAGEGAIRIYSYPCRPDGIPGDDSDLIDEAVRWAQEVGTTRVLGIARQFQPRLVERIESAFLKARVI